MTFLETPRFPDYVGYGTAGGPEWQTVIAESSSGNEVRNQRWASARHRYDLSHTGRTQAELTEIVSFFHAVKGRAIGFRYKDWGDYSVTVANGILGTAVGSGLAAYQLTKRYTSGASTTDREITKPVTGTVTVYRGGIAVVWGAGAGQASIDTTTGIITFIQDNSKAISTHTPGATHVFTTATDMSQLSIGEKVYLLGCTVTGGTDVVNGVAHTISNKTGAGPYTWTLATSTVGLTVSSGTAYAYAQAGETLTWAGEFDVPVRFGQDQFQTSIVARPGNSNIYQISALELIEVRV